MRRRLEAWLTRRVRKAADPAAERERLIRGYVEGGRIAWSAGYKSYRADLLRRVVRDDALLEMFRRGDPLPPGFGRGIDERVVEYPWALSRLDAGASKLFDAGSTLNFLYLLDLPVLAHKTIVIQTLAPEHLEARPNVSYLFGDLRDLLLRADLFDAIVCISTLEHIGLDNTRLYTADERFREASAGDYLRALAELRRVLAPGGRLLLTVPYGRAESLGWMQQFDAAGLASIVEAFGARPVEPAYFRYVDDEWSRSDDAACADASYFDVHTAAAPAPDGAAAARAVACLEFRKPPG